MRKPECIVVHTEAPFPPGHVTEAVRDADVVLLKRLNGLWTVWKDRHGLTLRDAPWDELPARIKALVAPNDAP